MEELDAMPLVGENYFIFILVTITQQMSQIDLCPSLSCLL